MKLTTTATTTLPPLVRQSSLTAATTSSAIIPHTLVAPVTTIYDDRQQRQESSDGGNAKRWHSLDPMGDGFADVGYVTEIDGGDAALADDGTTGNKTSPLANTSTSTTATVQRGGGSLRSWLVGWFQGASGSGSAVAPRSTAAAPVTVGGSGGGSGETTKPLMTSTESESIV